MTKLVVVERKSGYWERESVAWIQIRVICHQMSGSYARREGMATSMSFDPAAQPPADNWTDDSHLMTVTTQLILACIILISTPPAQ